MNKEQRDALMSLAHGGDLRRVRASLPTDVNLVDDDGRTLLMWATLGNRKLIVKYLLLECKADADILSNDKLTAFCVAASFGHVGLIPYLAPKTADHNLPLRTAARHGYLDFATQLFKIGKATDIRGAILAAAAMDQAPVVRFFLKKASDPDGALFRAAMHSAVINGALKTTKMLTGMHLDMLDGTDCECHFTLLHLAAEHNRVKVARYLVEEMNADLERPADDGITPLHAAAGEKHKEMIIFLRQAGANLHAKKANGLTAFHLACARGYHDVADLLFALKSDVHTTDNEGCTPLHSAAYGNHLSLVRKLVQEYGANPSARSHDGSTVIHAAVVNNAAQALQYLGQKTNVDAPDHDGRLPVRLAVAENQLEALRCLFEQCHTDRFVVDKQGWTLLHVATAKGNLEVVKYLVQQGLSPNAIDNLGFTPLYYAAYSNRFECAEFLATVTTAEEVDGFTPIAIAAAHGNLRIVQLLLTPANLNVRNHQGFTPVMGAAMNHQLAVVKELAIQGADLELETNTGHRALHLAAEIGALPIVKFLVGKRRVKVDAKTAQGCTPLMCSVQNMHEKVAKWLVRNGDAAPRLDSKCGTAVDIAASHAKQNPAMRTLAHWLGRQCGNCGRWGRQQCSGCNAAYYCNTDCQRVNREKHKSECGK